MAIEKYSFKVSRLDSEFASQSRDSMSSEDDELQKQSPAIELEDDDDEFDDCDSGAGSDDFDLLELGEVGEEFCQVDNQTCSIPFELYDLSSLGDVLSMDVWNECLSEEDRFFLAKYLPDVDQEMFMRTLKELFTGSNLHFGSPITKLFGMLKGGLCEPRVALYRQGLRSFQKRQHYHLLRKHQDSVVSNLYQIKAAWLSCRGYSIEEKLRVLNIMKSQTRLKHENMEELESDSSERDGFGVLWSKKLKAQKYGLKTGRHPLHRTSPTSDFTSRGTPMPLEQAKFGKQNPKGTLKLAGSKTSSAKELVGRFPSFHNGAEMKVGPHGSPLAAIPRTNKSAGYDLGAAGRMKDHMRVDDVEETMYEVAVQRDPSFSRISSLDKVGPVKTGKNREGLKVGDYTTNCFMGLDDVHTYGGKRSVNKLSDINILTAKPSNAKKPHDYGKRVKYLENVPQFPVEEPMNYGKGHDLNSSLKGSRNELSEESIPFWHNKAQGEALSAEYGDWNVKSNKWKMERESSDFKANERLPMTDYRTRPSLEKVREVSVQNRGRDGVAPRGSRLYYNTEETESDSSRLSDEDEDDEDDNPLMRSKLAYPHGVLNGSLMKSGPEPKNAKVFTKEKKNRPPDGLSHTSRKIADMGYLQSSSLKAKKKGKMHDMGNLQNSAAKLLEDRNFSVSCQLNGDDNQKQMHELMKNDSQSQGEHNDRFHMPLRAQPAERRQKGHFGRDHSVHQSNQFHDYVADVDSRETQKLSEYNGGTGRPGKKAKGMEAYGGERYERPDVPLAFEKDLKVKEDVTQDEGDDTDHVHLFSQQQLGATTFSKKWGKRKSEDDSGPFELGTSETLVAEMGSADVEIEPISQKKPFTLITPTFHTGFSFSIIHLLSAVRMAMVTLLPEDSLDVGKHLDKNDGRDKCMEDHNRKQEVTNGLHSLLNFKINNSENSMQCNVPFLTVQEIINRVRSNPGDPFILETQEPLQDLVRGVLKIFLSKSAPLGAKGWKQLVLYEKSTKSWSWIGPASHCLSDHEVIEEMTSPESWGLPHKMLVKLVDTFANWLKSGQETLQQIGSLPSPPLSLMQFNLEEKERFRDLRAQKSLITISPSSEEVKVYFQKEEVLRYSIPDRAFSYTAIDGRKSIVAPLRRCGGKPTSKARDHFMLKRDRPPHVTILCLVRDAAARLPGSIGTRADVCTLLRDSQYIVEDVSDAQVNQVVSGALDRLHYERDPCVQYDGERKLWVYLHREREEEDFEDDGTSSTKKWKRPKKEAAEPFEQGTVTLAYHGSGEHTGVELSSDFSAEPSCRDENKRLEIADFNTNHITEEKVETIYGYEQGAMHQGHPMDWESLRLTPMRENRLLCQENSTNEDFDDEMFDIDAPELLSTSLS